MSVIMYVLPSFKKRCMGTRLDNEKQLCNYPRSDTHVHIYGWAIGTKHDENIKIIRIVMLCWA
jgi:hypothetical protein